MSTTHFKWVYVVRGRYCSHYTVDHCTVTPSVVKYHKVCYSVVRCKKREIKRDDDDKYKTVVVPRFHKDKIKIKKFVLSLLLYNDISSVAANN